MTAPTTVWPLMIGVALVLVLATIVGRLLRIRAGADGRSETFENLSARIDSWWVIFTLAAVAFAVGRSGVIVLFGLLSFAALREYMSLAPLSRSDHRALVLSFFVAVPVQYALVATNAYGLYSILIPVYAFVLLPIVSAARGETRDFLRRAAAAQWGLMATVYCLSHAAALATLETPGFAGQSLLLVLFLLLVTQLSDVLQFVAGKILGRRPIAPTLSPGKTLEGTILGILGATLIGTVLFPFTPFTPIEAACLSLVLALMGFFGGVVMSAIKRDLGVKDWGTTIPGHGGVLDRIDSLVFAAPVFFHLTRFGWAIT